MTLRRCARSKVLALLAYGNLRKTDSFRSYRADIILMLNRGIRRLVVSLGQFPQTATLCSRFLKVSLDEVRAHNRELADGYLFHTQHIYWCTNTLVGC